MIMCLIITGQYLCCHLSSVVIYSFFSDYFLKQNLLYDGQCGFQKIHSTELAAIELVDRIHLYMNKGQIPLSVFVDLS